MDCSMIPFHILLPNIPKPVVSFQDSVYNFLTYIFFFKLKNQMISLLGLFIKTIQYCVTENKTLYYQRTIDLET